MRKGSKHSEDSKRKASISRTETYKIRGSHRKGTKFTPEQLKRLSDAHKGIKPTEKQLEVLRMGREIGHAMVFVEGKSNNPIYRSWICNLNSYRRREAGKLYGSPHSKEEWENLKKEYNFTCPACLQKEPKIKLTRDHIISLSKGGSDKIENIQPLCKYCNSKKQTKNIKY